MKKRNIIIIAIIVIVIIIALLLGYFIWFSKESDEITLLLKDLKANIKLDFSESRDAEFNWITADKELVVKGKFIEAKAVNLDEYTKIEEFFSQQGFEPDNYNVSFDSLKRVSGYRRDNVVCIFEIKASNGSNSQLKDFKTECGFLDSGSLLSPEQALKNIFAIKYNISDFSLEIIKEEGNYIQGSIIFSDDFGGNFLAFNNNGHWQIVYDGNGVIPCEQVEEYNFPEDMVLDCSYIQTIEVSQGKEFSISLGMNVLSNYIWSLKFLDQEYIGFSAENISFNYLDEEKTQLEETIEFTALKKGETEIRFIYTCCSPDKPALEERIYKIIIK